MIRSLDFGYQLGLSRVLNEAPPHDIAVVSLSHLAALEVRHVPQGWLVALAPCVPRWFGYRRGRSLYRDSISYRTGTSVYQIVCFGLSAGKLSLCIYQRPPKFL